MKVHFKVIQPTRTLEVVDVLFFNLPRCVIMTKHFRYLITFKVISMKDFLL